MDFENCSKTLKDNISLMTKFQGKSRKQEVEVLRLKINAAARALFLDFMWGLYTREY